ncbi:MULTISPECIES: bestrophin family protein [unclassified Psychrobacter]|jgi:putative membrane protein|uniref:bestrophin family protein n=1 Tax=Psychrobacter TaxID=497 RepID=UPI0008A67CE6|nr:MULTISPECIES: bestrophin family ion channel [unclassified Psychrobacter]AOY42574.1 inner membrane protein [Psychrobacter sp. AntiMn-1]|tara:strand:- start:8129 stop:9055 length:927 start_codon:yes stop_codon:yes gene_type:complete
MIVRQTPHPFKIFFALRGSIIPKIYPQLLLVTILSTAITIIQHWIPDSFPYYGITTFTLLGIALSLFLGFRNNASYQRWWEARMLWGQLVYDARSLTRQVLSFIDDDNEHGRETQRTMVYLTIAFAHAVRHRLRGTPPWADIDPFVASIHHNGMRQAKNVPDHIMRLMGKHLGDIRRQGLVSEQVIQNMDERLTSMTIVLAACERIHNTPLPFAYMLLVHRTTYLYCVMLPFGLVASLGWATPLVCAVIAYTFFGLDALSEELEEPFGLAANQLPLTALSRTIEINLREALGETNLPTDIMPIDGYLP